MTVVNFKWTHWEGNAPIPEDVEITDEVMVRYRDLVIESGVAAEFHWEKYSNSHSIFDIVDYTKVKDLD